MILYFLDLLKLKIICFECQMLSLKCCNTLLLQDSMRGLFEPVVFDVEFNITTSGDGKCEKGCPVVNKFNPTNENPFAKTRKYSVSFHIDKPRHGPCDKL